MGPFHAIYEEVWYPIKSNATKQGDEITKILKDSEVFTGVGD